jgi:hypothetical protein
MNGVNGIEKMVLHFYGLMVVKIIIFEVNMLKYEVIYQHLTTTGHTNIRYYRYGEVHRKFYPAMIWVTGSMAWREYSYCHRKDAPAVIWYDSYEEYWIRGNRVKI